MVVTVAMTITIMVTAAVTVWNPPQQDSAALATLEPEVNMRVRVGIRVRFGHECDKSFASRSRCMLRSP